MKAEHYYQALQFRFIEYVREYRYERPSYFGHALNLEFERKSKYNQSEQLKKSQKEKIKSISSNWEEEIENFFSENKDLEINEFMILFEEKYGLYYKHLAERKSNENIKKIKSYVAFFFWITTMSLVVSFILVVTR